MAVPPSSGRLVIRLVAPRLGRLGVDPFVGGHPEVGGGGTGGDRSGGDVGHGRRVLEVGVVEGHHRHRVDVRLLGGKIR